MTKHTAGKYGRTIGSKERKAGWPSPATAWCYLCNGSHSWAEGCRGGHEIAALADRQEQRTASRRAA